MNMSIYEIMKNITLNGELNKKENYIIDIYINNILLFRLNKSQIKQLVDTLSITTITYVKNATLKYDNNLFDIDTYKLYIELL